MLRPGQHSQDVINRGGTPPLRITSEITSTEQVRRGNRNVVNVSTGRIENTSYGESVVDVSLARTMRSIPVTVSASRLKPNTRYYCFFDGVNVDAWVSPGFQYTGVDGLTDYPAGRRSGNSGFGVPLISDGRGVVRAIFLIPNGRPPVNGTVTLQVLTGLNTRQVVQLAPSTLEQEHSD